MINQSVRSVFSVTDPSPVRYRRAAPAARRQSRHAARYGDGQCHRLPVVDGPLTPRQRRLSDAGDRHRSGSVRVPAELSAALEAGLKEPA